MFSAVKTMFSRHPLICNSVVYGILYTGAEFSQQTVTRKIMVDRPKDYSVDSLARFGLYGTSVQAPALYYWYRWLDKAFRGRAATTIIKKMFLDQFLLTPPLLVAFYISMSLMEGKENIIEECKRKVMPTFKTSCMFWLPAQALNFMVVPPAARVVYVGSCALVWVNILCWFKRQDY
ncbi:mpv17-like protein isoform X2 [Anabrus simplex]|uniref:mpv17-like protein isoform X2 n=1 Tax=Anabrus simplex TaxID=316456 RepID=UPI0035A2954A